MIAHRFIQLAISTTIIPLTTARAVLRTPQVVRSHPRSRELRSLERAGFELESVRVGHRGMPTVVEVVRDGDRRVVRDADAAFTIYALSRMQRRRRVIATPS